MDRITQGVAVFRQMIFPHKRTLFAQLEKGQTPQALFITCSDSRVDPNLLTQCGPGELFVLRNAGNLVPAYDEVSDGGEAATIEYAMAALKVPHIIVCGHSRCGAMHAVLKGGAPSLPAVNGFLRHAAKCVDCDNPDDAQNIERQVQANVLKQLENLRTHPSVAKRLEAGEVKLHGWMYRFESGEIFAAVPEEEKFAALDTVEASQA